MKMDKDIVLKKGILISSEALKLKVLSRKALSTYDIVFIHTSKNLGPLNESLLLKEFNCDKYTIKVKLVTNSDQLLNIINNNFLNHNFAFKLLHFPEFPFRVDIEKLTKNSKFTINRLNLHNVCKKKYRIYGNSGLIPRHDFFKAVNLIQNNLNRPKKISDLVNFLKEILDIPKKTAKKLVRNALCLQLITITNDQLNYSSELLQFGKKNSSTTAFFDEPSIAIKTDPNQSILDALEANIQM